MQDTAYTVLDDTKPAVMLHSSGSTANQWRDLVALLEPEWKTLTPDQWGCGDAGPWSGERSFTLSEEAAPVIRLIEPGERPIHLVGHSYGGGVALNIARRYPELIASLTLVEPTAFHLLKDGSDGDKTLYREVQAVAETVAVGLRTGQFRLSMRQFVDYWNGDGTWEQLSPERQAVLVGRLTKLPLDFRALMEEDAGPDDFRSLDVPTLLIRGTESPNPAGRISEILYLVLPRSELVTIAGAGHMAPLTHGHEVNPLILAHIRHHDQTARIAEKGDTSCSHKKVPVGGTGLPLPSY
jgi:pimeloyl-ACP methyl ester carboxylesterase